MRTRRGFDRARYFAKSLGIEENRYTRYERAEVEPSLTLIHKMCETLRVSPNELLGFGEAAAQSLAGALGMAEEATEAISGAHGQGEVGAGPDTASSLAWSLASEAIALRHEQGGKSKAAGDPMRTLQETSTLFRRLQADPFRTVAELARRPVAEGCRSRAQGQAGRSDPRLHREHDRARRPASALTLEAICGSRRPSPL